MQRRTFLKATTAGVATSVPLLAGCTAPTKEGDTGNGGGSKPDSGTTQSDSRDVTNTIKMTSSGGNYYFDPVGLFVEPGETIEWVIGSGVHSTTAYKKRIPEGVKAWDSGILTGGSSSFTHTFDVKGTYDYYCIPHETLGMVARIVVGEPGGPAVGTQPPHGRVPKSQKIVEKGAISFSEWHS